MNDAPSSHSVEAAMLEPHAPAPVSPPCAPAPSSAAQLAPDPAQDGPLALGIGDLPPDLLRHIIELSTEASAPALLLVCKAWSRMVQPDCFATPPECSQLCRKALASAAVRHAVVTDFPDLPAALSRWTRLSFLELTCVKLGCLTALGHATRTLRSLRLSNCLFDDAGDAALLATLRAATVLEHFALQDTAYDVLIDEKPFEPLKGCATLRSLELSRVLSVGFASELSQLTHFKWEWGGAYTDADVGGVTPFSDALRSLTVHSTVFGEFAESADLASALHGNSSITALDVATDPPGDDLMAAFAAMTGVTDLTVGMYHMPWRDVITRGWAGRLQRLRLLELCDDNSGLLRGLVRCRELTSLALCYTHNFGVDDDWEYGVAFDFRLWTERAPFLDAFACLAQCAQLRGLELSVTPFTTGVCDDVRVWDDFLRVLCDVVLPALRALTSLQIRPTPTAEDCARVEAAAACGVTWRQRELKRPGSLPVHAPGTPYMQSRAPAEYRLHRTPLVAGAHRSGLRSAKREALLEWLRQ